MSIENDNKRKIYINEKGSSKSLSFLYHNIFGRMILKALVNPCVSKIGGKFLNTRFSKRYISSFVKKNNINLDDYENRDYTSYNDFFTRKIKEGKRIVDTNPNSFISPCDSKISVYNIDETSSFKIKDTYYTLKDLLESNEIYKEYINGLCLIFRLAVDDYHRYCYIDDGNKGKNIFIKGKLHTVQSIALERYNVYKTNSREYSTLHTKNFGDIIQVEIGALMVGKIVNYHEEYNFKKGEEKGRFEFGGSTIVLLVKKDMVDIDEDILINSLNGDETIVKYGERIGSKHEKIG